MEQAKHYIMIMVNTGQNEKCFKCKYVTSLFAPMAGTFAMGWLKN